MNQNGYITLAGLRSRIKELEHDKHMEEGINERLRTVNREIKTALTALEEENRVLRKAFELFAKAVSTPQGWSKWISFYMTEAREALGAKE